MTASALISGNRTYHIINAGTDTLNVLKGYVNVLYNGPSALYVKYIKKIQPLADDGKYDLFYQGHLVYLRKGVETIQVTGKKRFMNLLEDKKKEIRDYLKRTGIKVTQKDPYTLSRYLNFMMVL